MPLTVTDSSYDVSQPSHQKVRHGPVTEKSKFASPSTSREITYIKSRNEFDQTKLLKGDHETDNDENQGTIMKSLQLIYKEILNVKEEQKLLRKALKRSVYSLQDSDSKLPPLPVKTHAELEALDLILNDEIERKNLICILSNFASSSLRSTVHSIMRNVIASEVAVLYSLHGKGEKMPFIDLKLFSCIQGNY